MLILSSIYLPPQECINTHTSSPLETNVLSPQQDPPASRDNSDMTTIKQTLIQPILLFFLYAFSMHHPLILEVIHDRD